jgi:2C-methyl-D-erythritol 2,4-cyclodiphosphate synthase
MREKLSGALGLPASAVSVKAKTNEKLDAVGAKKGLMVFAIASLGGA